MYCLSALGTLLNRESRRMAAAIPAHSSKLAALRKYFECARGKLDNVARGAPAVNEADLLELPGHPINRLAGTQPSDTDVIRTPISKIAAAETTGITRKNGLSLRLCSGSRFLA